MRAVVYDHYGPPSVLHLEEVERPEPMENQVLIRVHAATVNLSDCGWRSGRPLIVRYFLGFLRPRRHILGGEMAGVVEAVGSAVTEFKVGDRIFGMSGFGAHAEFVCVRESAAVTVIPAGIPFEEATAVADGALTALSCLRRAEFQAGTKILIYGASGSIGSAAVQLAANVGADVTAVCGTKNLELVRSLGAREVIDYQREDFTKNGQTYDVVFDAVGMHSFWRSRRSVRPGGTYIATDGLRNLLWMLWTSRIGKVRAVLGIARYAKADILFVKGLLETGRYRAIVDRHYPLEDIVEAATYVETRQKTGNVVLTVRA